MGTVDEHAIGHAIGYKNDTIMVLTIFLRSISLVRLSHSLSLSVMTAIIIMVMVILDIIDHTMDTDGVIHMVMDMVGVF